jgi:hypothetical protein
MLKRIDRAAEGRGVAVGTAEAVQALMDGGARDNGSARVQGSSAQ